MKGYKGFNSLGGRAIMTKQLVEFVPVMALDQIRDAEMKRMKRDLERAEDMNFFLLLLVLVLVIAFCIAMR